MALRNVLPILLGVFLVIVTIFASTWSFAQRGEDSIKDLSRDQGIQKGTMNEQNPWVNEKSGAMPADSSYQYSRRPWPTRYTLLDSQTRYCLASDLSVGGFSNRIANSLTDISMGEKLLNYEPQAQKSIFLWHDGSDKSYLIPALEIIGFNLVLNAAARFSYPNETENGKKVYQTNLSTFWDNLIHGPWVIDQDSFTFAQLRHPYQGAIYQGFARSAGLIGKISICFLYIESGCIISTSNHQPRKDRSTDH